MPAAGVGKASHTAHSCPWPSFMPLAIIHALGYREACMTLAMPEPKHQCQWWIVMDRGREGPGQGIVGGPAHGPGPAPILLPLAASWHSKSAPSTMRTCFSHAGLPSSSSYFNLHSAPPLHFHLAPHTTLGTLDYPVDPSGPLHMPFPHPSSTQHLLSSSPLLSRCTFLPPGT